VPTPQNNVDPALRLTGAVALITGSTRGIGWAIARSLARHGATVVLNGASSSAALEERVKEIRSEFGVEADGFLADAADAVAVRRCYAEIFRRFRRLDILVNNAGILRDALLGMFSQETISQVFATNTLGAVYHLQEASRLMSRGRRGSIINISSIVGRVGNEGQAVYAASKAALIGLTYAAAKELAPMNIRVNAVAPGFIETDMTKALPAEKHAERVASIKMGRIGQPEDIANAVLFFASELSSYVTGQVLGVDGAMLI
jgi:3-oxoacyl-[acyl-carrier protein] reductase